MHGRAMTAPQRFLFDRRFDAALPDGVDNDAAGAEPTFSAADVEQARAEGLACGRAEALARYNAERDYQQQRQATLEAIGAAVTRLLDASADSAAQASRDAVHVAGAIARRLLPRLWQEHARSEIEELVATTLARLPAEPAVHVRIAEALIADLAPQLRAAAAAHGGGERLRVSGDAAIAVGDCVVEWTGGGIVRDRETLWHDIEALIEDTVGGPAPDAGAAAAPRDVPGETHDRGS